MKNLSIRAKLILLIIIVIFPLAIFQTITIPDELNYRTKSIMESNVDKARALSNSLFIYIKEIWTQELYLGLSLNDKPDMTTKEMQDYLTDAISQNETIVRLNWLNPDGVIVASSEPSLIGQSLSKREYYQKILNGEEKIVSYLQVGLLDGKPAIPIVRAIKKDGKLVGIIVGILDLKKFASGSLNMRLSRGDIFGFVEKNGMIIYRSDNKELSMQQRQIPKNASVWRALKGEIVKECKSSSVYRDGISITVENPIKELGWVCFVSSNHKIVLEESYAKAVKSYIALIIIFLTSISVALLTANLILRPLDSLKSAAYSLINGNMKARTNIVGNDEISKTAHAFDIMAEALEEYDKLKMQFFSNISHELRTPLNVILASVQLLEYVKTTMPDDDKTSKIFNNVKIIKQNCYRLIRLVGNLIDITRFDNGILKPKFANHDIVAIVKGITMSITQYAEHKKIRIIFDTQMKEKIIACDIDMIERIVLNLISNSLKFTDEGGIISVYIYEEQDMVKISVEDTGIGISEDNLKIIFERFRQVDESLIRNNEGSGIGLSIVKSLVEAHNGAITVESELGVSTEYIISLPSKTIQDFEDGDENKSQNRIENLDIEFSDIYPFSDTK